jgi:anti-sigma regulatory factor (Ser/Thr protein kinase)
VSSSLLSSLQKPEDLFRHEAFFYAGDDEFLEGTTDFIRAGARAAEPILVVVSARKIDLLRKRLKSDAGKVQFADMEDVGINPARIIPAWTDFVSKCEDRPLRGIGEPIWAERSSAELVECQHHESLLNVAFAETTGFNLMCPYDTGALGPDVVTEAFHSHPFIRQAGAQLASPEFVGIDELSRPLSAPLPAPPTRCTKLAFHSGSLRDLRSMVLRAAKDAGIDDERADDTVTAVHEVASNSVRHAGGRGVLLMWQADHALICEISDDGHIEEPLVGRKRPEIGDQGGRGLWMVNQLCELVQVRSTSNRTTVRMHFRRHPLR